MMELVVPTVGAIGSLGLVLGIGIGYASKKFYVEEDPRLGAVIEALPGANCGGCGYPGCSGMGNAIVKGEALPSGCPVGNEDTVRNISEIMGLEVSMAVKMVAFVKCNGDCDQAINLYPYKGFTDCNATAQLIDGGPKSCNFGCLGGGSCVKACPFDAIDIVNGIAQINREKCVGCAACVPVCPKKLIELVPYESNVLVACNSNDPGKVVNSHCNVGCIACKICERTCEYDAIKVDNFLAKVDYDKCTNCNACVAKCPKKTIIMADPTLPAYYGHEELAKEKELVEA